MKKIVLLAVILLGRGVAGAYSGGTGTALNPYLITTTGDLVTLSTTSSDWGMHFRLENNLDMNGVAFTTPIGNAGVKFTGTFNGNDFTISNLTINLPATNYVGLFGWVKNIIDPNAISNLGLIGANMTGKDHVGILAGKNESIITHCYSTGNISGNFYTGNLVGMNYNTIINCYATGSVNGTDQTGGLVGRSISTGRISHCYATGSVNGTNQTGGLVGWNHGGEIINCYSVGAVNGTSETGGLIGKNVSAVIINSFWDTVTSGQLTSAGGIGKTTVEMQQAGTFTAAGWDFINAWGINENTTYPYLLIFNGAGTIGTPYLIYTIGDLMNLSLNPAYWDKDFRLENDLDMTGIVGFTPIGTDSLTSFLGTFNGNGHVITNLTINLPTTGYVGLFGHVKNLIDPNAIFNLGLIDPNIVGSYYTGSLVGWNESGAINNCYATGGMIIGVFAGGLVGTNSHGVISNGYTTSNVDAITTGGGLVGQNILGTISNCYAAGNTTGTGTDSSNIGGLVGHNFQGTVTLCYAAGNTMITQNRLTQGGFFAIGGLVGWNSVGTLTLCYATGSVSGTDDYTGGLVGDNGGNVTNCYAVGSVAGNGRTGGLVGFNYGAITNCYTTGGVIGAGASVSTSTGGLLATNSGGTITDSCWNTETTGQLTSEGGVGLTTFLMKSIITYTGAAGWDFNSIWDMKIKGYPHLKWEGVFTCNAPPVTDMNFDCVIDMLDMAIWSSEWLTCNYDNQGFCPL